MATAFIKFAIDPKTSFWAPKGRVIVGIDYTG
jgi:hypothetical protein